MANWQERVASLTLQRRLSMVFSVWTVLLSFSRVDWFVDVSSLTHCYAAFLWFFILFKECQSNSQSTYS